MSNHYGVYFNIASFNQQEAPVRAVRKRYLTSEVAANFIEVFKCTPAEILPAPCDFNVESFNSKLTSTLGSVAPLLTKTEKPKHLPPWRRKPEIIKSKQQCRSAERRRRKSKVTVHYKVLREQLKSYNKTKREKEFSSPQNLSQAYHRVYADLHKVLHKVHSPGATGSKCYL